MQDISLAEDTLRVYERDMRERTERIEALVGKARDEERSLTDAEDAVVRDLATEVEDLEKRSQAYQTALRTQQAVGALQRQINGAEEGRLRANTDDAAEFLRSYEGKPGEFVADLLRATHEGDRRMLGNFERAMQQEKTSDVPGALPIPVVGPLIAIFDDSRPVSQAFTQVQMPAKGATFLRPKVTGRTTAGKQSAEFAELPSGKFTIEHLNGAKATYGGALQVSRQTIDWTEPAVLSLIFTDLVRATADAVEADVQTLALTEAAKHKITFDLFNATVPTADKVMKALADSAVSVVNGIKALPNRIIMSIDTWAKLKSICFSDGRPILGPATGAGVNNLGEQAGIGSFATTLDGIPAIVATKAPAKTLVVANSAAIEVGLDTRGLLTVEAPKSLYTEVASYAYASSLVIESAGTASIAA